MKKRYYSLYANEYLLNNIAINNKSINRNTLILALLLPASASLCDEKNHIKYSNIVIIDKQFIAKYTLFMGITQRTFKNSLKELLSLEIIAKDNKDKYSYFINPWWACSGQDPEIQSFRRFVVENQLFAPSIHYNDDDGEYIVHLEKVLNSIPSKEQHTAIYLNYKSASAYLALTSADNAEKLNTVDIVIFILFALRCRFVKSREFNANLVKMSRTEQEHIRR